MDINGWHTCILAIHTAKNRSDWFHVWQQKPSKTPTHRTDAALPHPTQEGSWAKKHGQHLYDDPFLWSSYKLCLLLGCDLSNIIESQAISDFLWWKQIFLKWVDNGISNNLPSSSRESLRVVKAFRKFCLAIWCPKRSTQQPWCQSFFGIFFLVSSSHQLATATCQRLRPLDRWPSSILLIDGTIKSI